MKFSEIPEGSKFHTVEGKEYIKLYEEDKCFYLDIEYLHCVNSVGLYPSDIAGKMWCMLPDNKVTIFHD